MPGRMPALIETFSLGQPQVLVKSGRITGAFGASKSSHFLHVVSIRWFSQNA